MGKLRARGSFVSQFEMLSREILEIGEGWYVTPVRRVVYVLEEDGVKG